MSRNPLDMTREQASNLALLVGLGLILYYGFTGFDPNAALIGVVGTGCIAQRFVLGTNGKGDPDDGHDGKGKDVGIGPTDPPTDPAGDGASGGRPGPHSHRQRLGFLSSVVGP